MTVTHLVKSLLEVIYGKNKIDTPLNEFKIVFLT